MAVLELVERNWAQLMEWDSPHALFVRTLVDLVLNRMGLVVNRQKFCVNHLDLVHSLTDITINLANLTLSHVGLAHSLVALIPNLVGNIHSHAGLVSLILDLNMHAHVSLHADLSHETES